VGTAYSWFDPNANINDNNNTNGDTNNTNNSTSESNPSDSGAAEVKQLHCFISSVENDISFTNKNSLILLLIALSGLLYKVILRKKISVID
jgi:hypothetical protein